MSDSHKNPMLAGLIRLGFAVLGLVAGLHSGAARGQTTPEAPPPLRVDDRARPLRYRLDLTLVPGRDRFEGAVEIDLDLKREMSLLWLNATALQVRKAELRTGSGAPVSARVVPGNDQFLGVSFPQPAGPGRATVRVEYSGRVQSAEAAGIFQREDLGERYLYTQFEPLDARRAFPCFDEPGFKVPWQVTLHVRRRDTALSNSPWASEVQEPEGMKAVRFLETEPLPTYLVAMAVGPFDIVDLDKTGQKRTSVRLIVPRGRSGETRYAARSAPRILAQLEACFGTPYPFRKLDLIAVPQMGGAMENAGLVTFERSLMLTPPGAESAQFQREWTSVCAHELAHQWFGDLVTMAWWDDLWLNEAFATWMDPHIVDALHAPWRTRLEAIGTRNSFAMQTDGLVSARRIRQPITEPGDVLNAFDGITYSKGAAVLDMIEEWVGPETFRKAVRAYLAKHARGNATADDFVSAVSAASGQDVGPVFRSFLDQPGVPRVTVERLAAAGRAKVRLTQARDLPLGSEGSRDATWQIPVHLRFGRGKTGRELTVLLSKKSQEVPLPGPAPEWVVANAGQHGYFRVNYERGLLEPLLAPGGPLALPDRIGLARDVMALVRSGDLPASDALRRLDRIHAVPDRLVLSATSDMVRWLANLVPPELRGPYAAYVRKTFGARARALGWAPRPGEDEESRLLRPILLKVVTTQGDDPLLCAEAARRVGVWLKTGKELQPDVRGVAFQAAARHGSAELLQAFVQAARTTRDSRVREELLGALGTFREPVLLRQALALVLSGPFHPGDSLAILNSAGENGDPVSRPIAWEFLRQNWDALVRRLPAGALPFMIFNATGFSDPQSLASVEIFAKERWPRLPGGSRLLDQAREQIRINIAVRVRQEPSLRGFLR